MRIFVAVKFLIMMKLQTPVAEEPCRVSISYDDKILLLGSCFSDNLGGALVNYGFDALVNPFGTLYNPASILAALRRLACGKEFDERDCVPMGSGSALVCSFGHHTSFARAEKADFLQDANAALREAAVFFRDCNKVIITLGTAWCFRYVGTVQSREVIDSQYDGTIVSNCLKREGKEFERFRLSFEECSALLRMLIATCDVGAGAPGAVADAPGTPKEIIFTVSPIRHLADGAHGNALSKSALLLAIDSVCGEYGVHSDHHCDYFPAYEIMMDELRDYRFYAEDMLHPSQQAINYITDRFLSRTLVLSDKPLLDERIRAYKRSLHRDLH